MTSSVILTFHRVWLLKSLGSITFYTVETETKRNIYENTKQMRPIPNSRNSTRFSVMIHENNLFFYCILVSQYRAIYIEHRTLPAVMTKIEIAIDNSIHINRWTALSEQCSMNNSIRWTLFHFNTIMWKMRLLKVYCIKDDCIIINLIINFNWFLLNVTFSLCIYRVKKIIDLLQTSPLFHRNKKMPLKDPTFVCYSFELRF